MAFVTIPRNPKDAIAGREMSRVAGMNHSVRKRWPFAIVDRITINHLSNSIDITLP